MEYKLIEGKNGMYKKEKERVMQLILILSVAMCFFQIYTAATVPLQAMSQRGIHLSFLIPIAFLYEAIKWKDKQGVRIMCYLAAMLSFCSTAYLSANWIELQNRTTRLIPLDYAMAISLILIVLFLTFRSIGIWMPMITVLFLFYAFVGPYLPGMFSFPQISFRRLIATMYCGTEGMFGTCLGAAATFVFTFVLFGEFLIRYGAGDFFINLAESAMGHVRGGTGKIAVITSALFGMVSGSPTANVAATGCLTIPLMKQSGYNAEYAGGVVAAAASGGVIMPPVMGTGAFVMAELIGVSYGVICIAALFPAVLYFLALLVMVDINAVKNGLSGKQEKQKYPRMRVLREGWHYLLCIFVLLLLLVGLQWSPAKSAFYAIITLLTADVINHVIQNKTYDVTRFWDIFLNACKNAIPVTASTTCAGLIIGAFNATGLNLRLSSMLIEFSGNSILILLILTMVCAIVLGMGLPPTSVYILLAVMVAPALISMEIPKLAAHLFIFYFSSMASITPPVGTAFYVSAGLAQSRPMRTGLVAWYTALPAFLLPYIWVYEPAFLLDGTPPVILWSVLTGVVGIVALAYGLEGYLFVPLSKLLRGMLLLAALLTVIPEFWSSVIGFVLIGAVLLIQRSHGAESGEEKNDLKNLPVD